MKMKMFYDQRLPVLTRCGIVRHGENLKKMMTQKTKNASGDLPIRADATNVFASLSKVAGIWFYANSIRTLVCIHTHRLTYMYE